MRQLELTPKLARSRRRRELLLIVDGDDARMPEAVVRLVFDACPSPKRIWTAPGAPHSAAAEAPGYWETVLGFLEADSLY